MSVACGAGSAIVFMESTGWSVRRRNHSPSPELGRRRTLAEKLQAPTDPLRQSYWPFPEVLLGENLCRSSTTGRASRLDPRPDRPARRRDRARGPDHASPAPTLADSPPISA